MGSAVSLSKNPIKIQRDQKRYDFTFIPQKQAQIGKFFMINEDTSSINERPSSKTCSLPCDYNIKNSHNFTKIIKKLNEVSPTCSIWEIWKSFFNISVLENYSEIPIIKNVSEDVILKDINRTFPNHPFFDQAQYGLYGQYALYRVLGKFSSMYPKVGYCQGMNYIVGFLLMVSGSAESEVFSFFIHLCEEFSLFECFSEEMQGLHKKMWMFDKLLKKFSPELSNHFIAQELTEDMWIFKWFLSLYTTVFDLKSIPVIWRFILERGPRGLFELGLGILSLLKAELLKSDLSEILQIFDELSSGKLKPEKIKSAAKKHKIKSTKFEKLQKDHRVFAEKLNSEVKNSENVKIEKKNVSKNNKSQYLVVQEITETLDDLPPFLKSKSGYCTPNRGASHTHKVFDYYKMGRVSFIEDKTLTEDESVNTKQFLDDLVSDKVTGDSFIIQICKDNK